MQTTTCKQATCPNIYIMERFNTVCWHLCSLVFNKSIQWFSKYISKKARPPHCRVKSFFRKPLCKHKSRATLINCVVESWKTTKMFCTCDGTLSLSVYQMRTTAQSLCCMGDTRHCWGWHVALRELYLELENSVWKLCQYLYSGGFPYLD